ncbi:MAG: N-acyl homoserine lactonase family protein [Bradyrhizobium sp.]
MTQEQLPDDVYEVYAIRYAANPRRMRGHNLVLDLRQEEAHPMDFYTWVAVGRNNAFIIDTGMSKSNAEKHGHQFLRCPIEQLRSLGVDPSTALHAIITHAHYDHIGNMDLLPKATFEMQRAEMDFISGPYMGQAWFRRPYDAQEVSRLLEYLFKGRVRLHGADRKIAPGLSVHWVGGHTPGQEVVRVKTKRGWVVLASDALHYYEEFDRRVPFVVATNFLEMMDAHDRIRDLADSDEHVVPAHDPLVMERYPAARPDLSGIAVRLDVPPKAAKG